MGNKMCKKKTEIDQTKSPTPFDRIINRLHLRPNSWKSDTHLNQKQVNRKTIENNNKLLSKSSDWSNEKSLEITENDDEAIHLPNPKLTLIFDNEKNSSTIPPIPPPRKHKKGIREKIETVAKNSLQVFQSKKPVDEPVCIKKIIKPTCPTDEHDCAIHNRNHKREQMKNELNQKQNDAVKTTTRITNKDEKRRKNLSVVSLPNYNELKLTIAKFDDIDKKVDDNSATSLPNETKKLTNSSGKLEICMTRCRSFGSLLPQQLLDRWKVRKIPTDNESDDSFGALEDWDLRLIEHYNPKDASLPRPRKNDNNNHHVLKDVESMIVTTVNNEKSTPAPPPKVPQRKSESFVIKKMNNNEVQVCNSNKDKCSQNTTATTTTTTSSVNLKSKENNEAEHSTLMKILEKYSIEDKQRAVSGKNIDQQAENCSFQFRQNLKLIEDFLCNEKMNTDRDLNVINNTNMVKT